MHNSPSCPAFPHQDLISMKTAVKMECIPFRLRAFDFARPPLSFCGLSQATRATLFRYFICNSGGVSKSQQLQTSFPRGCCLAGCKGEFSWSGSLIARRPGLLRAEPGHGHRATRGGRGRGGRGGRGRGGVSRSAETRRRPGHGDDRVGWGVVVVCWRSFENGAADLLPFV